MNREFSDAQLFMHSIQELERVRLERKKNKKQKVSATNAGSLSPADKAPASKSSSENGVAAVKDEVDDADEPMLEADAETSSSSATNGTDAAAATDAAHDDDEDEEDVIDPRIHYRPMVSELQAAVAELHQLINSIDLIRRREFMEEMRCIRENTAPKKEELEYLLESKATQVKESSSILLAGVENLARTVEKESVFFQGITHLLRKWKICAPIHGNIPKPFRAGEPLAVDCSFISGASRYMCIAAATAD